MTEPSQDREAGWVVMFYKMIFVYFSALHCVDFLVHSIEKQDLWDEIIKQLYFCHSLFLSIYAVRLAHSLPMDKLDFPGCF